MHIEKLYKELILCAVSKEGEELLSVLETLFKKSKLETIKGKQAFRRMLETYMEKGNENS